MKRQLIMALFVAASCMAKAQMTMSFSGIDGVTTKSLNTGTTLVEFPVGTDLQTVMSKASFAVDGTAVDTKDILPTPPSLSLTDDQEVTFLYKGKAYAFKFSEGKYFTAVFLSDPHIGQSDHDGTSVADMQNYVSKIVAMGKDGGAVLSFDALPGYTPTCDIAFSTGDMDADNSKNHDDFETAHSGFKNANIPFVTLLGNHDVVPDYWTGSNPDKGLTYGLGTNRSWGGMNSNDKSRELVKKYTDALSSYGINDLTYIEGSDKCKFNPCSFSFNGVRFYMGQTYWFQKPYKKPATALSSAKYYAPDGIISALETFVNSHTSEPSVWMQHYPFLAGSDCDRWWLDQNDVGKYIKTEDASDYGTHDDVAVYTEASAKAVAKKKKDKLAEIISKTKNPVHFSGHTHQFAVNTYNGIKDYTTAATGLIKGAAYIVLMKGNKGVVEVKQVQFSPEVMTGVADIEDNLLPADDYSAAAKLASSLTDLGVDVSEATTKLQSATSKADMDEATASMATAFDSYIQQQDEKDVDVTKLLGANTDFETAQGNADSKLTGVYAQAGWNEYAEFLSSETNAQYIKMQQTDTKGGGNKGLYLRAKWGDMPGRVQIVKQAALPAGSYKLGYYTAMVGSFSQNLNYIDVGTTRTMLVTPSASAPQQQETTIVVEKPTIVTISFGFIGGQGETEGAVYVDDITLSYTGNKLEPNTDMTGFIKNSNFGDGTVSKPVQGAGGNVTVPSNWDFQYSFEGWNDTKITDDGALNVWAETIKRAELSQAVTLPNGAYKLTADVKTDTEAAASTIAIYGAASNGNVGRSEEVGKANGDFNTYTCYFDVTDGNATIGIRSDKAYFQVKNFKLTYIGETADEETASSYLRQDYYWNGKNSLEFDATASKYANAKDVVVYPQVANQLVWAASATQFANADNKIVDGVCSNLVIADKQVFHTSQAFTAANATFSRSFATDVKSTVCLPFAPTAYEGKFYALDSDNGSVIMFKEARPEANTPYIYIADADGQLSATNVTIPATPSEMKTTATTSGFCMVGVYETTAVSNIYGFSTSGELLKATTATMNPFRSFIQSPEPVANAKAWTASFDSGATGIENIGNAIDTVDIMSMDGKPIKKNTSYANALQGLQKGMYIMRVGNNSKIITKQ